MRYWIGVVLLLVIVHYVIEGGVVMAEKINDWTEKGYRVKDVLNNGQLKLSNNQIIKLAGVEQSSLVKEKIVLLRTLVQKKIVAFKPDEYQGGDTGYLYVLGIDPDFLPADFGKDDSDVVGFLGLKMGFNKLKGLGKNLNSILIKKCLVNVDTNSNYELKNLFLKYKNMCGG